MKISNELDIIKPTTFNITREEIEETVEEMIEEKIFGQNIKLSKEQTIKVLSYVECDEFLAKNIRTSIRDSIVHVVENN